MCRVRTISRKDSGFPEFPQRLYASHLLNEVKIQSVLRGDAERPTEMIGPLGEFAQSKPGRAHGSLASNS
jgi:hypothetical protein